MISPSPSSSFLQRIYNAEPKNIFSVTVTGGGVQALYEIFATPGASASVMSAGVPFLDPKKDADHISFCGEHTTVMMADRSRQATAALFMAERGICAAAHCNLFGVGCTASLTTSKKKHGDHRCYVAVSSDRGVSTYSLTLQKGARSREDEDRVCSQLIFQAIADACGKPRAAGSGSEDQEQLECSAVFATPPESPVPHRLHRKTPYASQLAASDSCDSDDGGGGGTGNGGGNGGCGDDDGGSGDHADRDGAGRSRKKSFTRLFDPVDLAAAAVAAAAAAKVAAAAAAVDSRSESLEGPGGAGGGEHTESMAGGGGSGAGVAAAEEEDEDAAGHRSRRRRGSSNSNLLDPMLCGDKLERRLDCPRPDPLASVVVGRTRTALFLPHAIRPHTTPSAMQTAGAPQQRPAVLPGSASAPPAPAPVAGAGGGSDSPNAAVARGRNVVCFEDTALPEGSLVYSGSFNPLHEGHVRLAMAAKQAIVRGGAVGAARRRPRRQQVLLHRGARPPPAIVFEISAHNADKPPLSVAELQRRLEQFSPRNPLLRAAGLTADDYAVCISCEPLFVEKARLFPNCSLCMGVDTLRRLLDKRYYAGSDYEMVAALAAIHSHGVDVFVGGRVDGDSGRFVTMGDVLRSPGAPPLPANVLRMFAELREDDFRVDVTSTALREEQQHRRRGTHKDQQR